MSRTQNPSEAASPATISTTAHKKTRLRPWAVVLWLLVWQAASMILAAALPHGSLLLASPVDTAVRLGQLAVTAQFWASVGNSAAHILGGFLLSCAAAVALAALASRFRRLREALEPLVTAIKAVPVVSFIILAFLWISTDQLALVIAFLMVFPPVYLNLLEGIGRTDRGLLEMAQVFRVPFSRRLKNIYIPQVMPYFRSACSLALGLCWKAGVAAEVIGLPKGTIGDRLYQAKIYFETPDLFAWTLVIVAVSVAFEHLFLRLVDKAARKAGAQ